MNIPVRILKLLHNPLGVLQNRWIGIWERIRFGKGSDYSTVAYWNYRHKKYGFDLRGVGDKTKSHEQNSALLEEGRNVFLRVCAEAGVVLREARVLDVGCGTGYFAGVLREQGVKKYQGVDIVNTLFNGLGQKFPGYQFNVTDISIQKLTGWYDLILAMDVLQHIVSEQKFRFALENLKSVLAPKGTIVISTHLGPSKRDGFYVMRRPIEMFVSAFPGFTLSEAIRYADSYVFSLQGPE